MIPGELAALDSLVAAAPLEDWRAYLRWSVASFAAPFLGPRFEAEHLAHHRIVGKAHHLKPLWQRCLYAADEHIGEALGQAYVRTRVPCRGEVAHAGLVANLRSRAAASPRGRGVDVGHHPRGGPGQVGLHDFRGSAIRTAGATIRS